MTFSAVNYATLSTYFHNFVAILLIGCVAILLWLRLFKKVRAGHLVLLLSTFVVTFSYFKVDPFPYAWLSGINFPFLPSFALAMGPALWLHNKRAFKTLTLNDTLHYLPAVLVLADTLIFLILNPEQHPINAQLLLENRYLELKNRYILPSHIIMQSYPLIVFGYSIASISLQFLTESSLKNTYSIINIWITISAPLTLIILLNLVTNESLFSGASGINHFINFIIGCAHPLLLLHSIIIVRRALEKPALPSTKDKFTTNNNVDEAPMSTQPLTIADFISIEIENEDSLLLEHHVKKEGYLPTTPFTMDQWQEHFDEHQMKFADFKRAVRINRARRLIQNDYLESHSVDDLSKAVGYLSRTSFYTAFKDVVGIKFSVYRSDELHRTMIE